jgi:hypothetical protein
MATAVRLEIKAISYCVPGTPQGVFRCPSYRKTVLAHVDQQRTAGPPVPVLGYGIDGEQHVILHINVGEEIHHSVYFVKGPDSAGEDNRQVNIGVIRRLTPRPRTVEDYIPKSGAIEFPQLRPKFGHGQPLPFSEDAVRRAGVALRPSRACGGPCSTHHLNIACG